MAYNLQEKLDDLVNGWRDEIRTIERQAEARSEALDRTYDFLLARSLSDKNLNSVRDAIKKGYGLVDKWKQQQIELAEDRFTEKVIREVIWREWNAEIE